MSGIKTHRVVSGDTLSAIAIQNGTTVAKIVAANKKVSKDYNKLYCCWMGFIYYRVKIQENNPNRYKVWS